MTTQTSSFTYAAINTTTLNYSALTVIQVATVPAVDFSGLALFIPAGGAPPAEVAGQIGSSPTVQGLVWSAFGAGSFAAGSTETLDFATTVIANNPTRGISQFSEAFNFDYSSLGIQPGSAIFSAVETLRSNGIIIGQTTVTGPNVSSGFVALAQAYNAVQVDVAITLSVPNGVTLASAGIDFSTMQLAFQTAPLPTNGLPPSTGSFTTHVYYDTNGDGTQSGATETNLAGITVALLNSSGVATGSTAVTDANGNVSFVGLIPGNYEVTVAAPAGDVVTQHSNVAVEVAVVAGATTLAVEGVYAPAAFTTHVYFDSNGDSLQNNGETNLAGVTVALLNGSGVATGKTSVTDANGNVSFAGLVPGSYEVAVTTPAGDSVTQHTNVLTATTLLAGQTGTAVEGLTSPAAFTTHVYYDTNKDGIQSGVTETNLAGVTVSLLTGTGASTGKTAITDANGNASFTGLAPGSYEVAVTTPAGDTVTQHTNVGTPTTLLAGQTGTAIEGVVKSGPSISVDKTASSYAVNGNGCGTTVTYTYKVSNTGNAALDTLKLVDNHGNSVTPDNITPVAVNAAGSQYNVGDTNHNGVLDVGETWTFQAKVNETGNRTDDSSTSGETHISGFNTSGGETLWARSSLNGCKTDDGNSYSFKGVKAHITYADGSKHDYDVPDSTVNFSKSCATPKTTWDSVQHSWTTTLPAGGNPGSVFMTGVPITVPDGVNMNGASVNFSVTDAHYAGTGGAPTWSVSTSAYDRFQTSSGDDASNDYSKIDVKACDSSYNGNSDNSGGDKAGSASGVQDNYSTDKYNQGTTDTSSTGDSSAISLTAIGDATAIDNVTVTAQTICASTPTSSGSDDNAGNYHGDDSGSGGDSRSSGGDSSDGSDGRKSGGDSRNSSDSNDSRKSGGDSRNRSDGSDGIKSGGDSIKSGGDSGSSSGDSSSSGSGSNDYNSSYSTGNSNNGYGSDSYANYSCSDSSSGWNGSSGSKDDYGGSSYRNGANTDEIWGSTRSDRTDNTNAASSHRSSGVDDKAVSRGTQNTEQETNSTSNCSSNGSTDTDSGTGCVVTTVTASDMVNVQVVTTNNIQIGGTATTAALSTAFGAAAKLEFTYDASNTVSPTNLQNGVAMANGSNSTGMAFIEVTNSANAFNTAAKIYFEGTVGNGAKFYADATTDIHNNSIAGGQFSTTAGQNLYTFVFADQASFLAHAAPVQTLIYDTTGQNGGMHIGDQIGSEKLVGYVSTTGHGYLTA